VSSQDVQDKSATSGTEVTTASEETDDSARNSTSSKTSSPCDVIRKGKTLAQYVSEWLQFTKQKLLFTFGDCQVDGVKGTITCLKCNHKPYNAVDKSSGGWKPSGFQNHVKFTHREIFDPDNDKAAPGIPLKKIKCQQKISFYYEF